MARSSTDSAPDDSTPETPLLPRYRSDSPPVDGADEKRARRGGAARAKGAGWLDPEDEEDTLGEYRGVRWMQGRRKVGCGACGLSSARCILAASILALAAVLAALAALVYLRHFRPIYRVYEDPLVPDPRQVEGMVGRFPRTLARNASETEEPVGPLAWRLQAIEDELQARFEALGLPGMTTLPCAGISANDTSLSSRYSALRRTGPSEPRQGKTLIALNLYNSEDVIPTLSHALLTVTSFLDPSTVHVSIFENGSTDKTTLALAHLAAALTALGVSHTILSDPRKTNWKAVDRIAQLAVYRNVVLAPLERDGDSFSDIVFINDVFVCPSDILELVFQRKEQEADAACATDWIANKGWASRLNPDVRFYDSWVSRSLSGETFRRQEDFLATLRKGVNVLFDQPGEERYKARWDKGLPVPVYSCWNGLLALDARPFTSTSVSPRYDRSSSLPSSSRKSWSRDPPIVATKPARFRSALTNPGECAASECKLIAKDFWSRGFDRWLIVPSVRVTYRETVYSNPALLSLSSLHPPSPAPTLDDQERIDWLSYTPPEEVVCWAWTPGPHVDFEWARAVWERPYETVAKVLSRG
ncbi:hypothetical protein JCM10049v2_004554 [Rhodotorula toruloides]